MYLLPHRMKWWCLNVILHLSKCIEIFRQRVRRSAYFRIWMFPWNSWIRQVSIKRNVSLSQISIIQTKHHQFIMLNSTRCMVLILIRACRLNLSMRSLTRLSGFFNQVSLKIYLHRKDCNRRRRISSKWRSMNYPITQDLRLLLNIYNHIKWKD